MARGQAAMEFLLSYGWAILVVIAAISALAYFGVFNTDRFASEYCRLAPGFGCSDVLLYSYDASVERPEVSFRLANRLGTDLTIQGGTFLIECPACAGGSSTSADGSGPSACWFDYHDAVTRLDFTNDWRLEDGKTVVVSCNPDTTANIIFDEAQAKIDFRFQYVLGSDSVDHQADGELFAHVRD